jgi:signal transduction histidine kinase
MLPSVSSDETAKEMLAGVAKGVARLQEIMNDMVSVIRVELADQSLTMVPVSIRSVIKSVENDQMNNMGGRQLTIETQVPNDLPMVSGDAKQLHSALARILGNAVKYTPDGGSITITAQLLTQGNGSGGPSFIEITVTDTGVGIALEKQRLIFDKFSTAEDVTLHSTSKTQFMGGGAGLGLTIAKGVVEAHNGRIWVESPGFDKDKLPGSKFFILLPTQA